jgi:hypothetical protein
MNRLSLFLGVLGLCLALVGCRSAVGTAVGAAKKVGSGVTSGVYKIVGSERGVSKEQLKTSAAEIPSGPQKVPPPPSPTPAAAAPASERFGLVVEEKPPQAPPQPASQPKAPPARKGMKAPFPLSILQGDFGQTTPPGGEHFASAIATVAAKLRGAFPQVSGVVILAKGDEVFIDLSSDGPVPEGTLLTVYEEGEPFKHPFTGEILGRLEKRVATVELTEVREKFYIARLLSTEPSEKVSAGQKVRITASKLRLAVLPYINRTSEAIETNDLTRTLARALESTERFDLYDQDKLDILLLEHDLDAQDLESPKAFSTIRGKVPVDYLMLNSIRTVNGRSVLDTKVITPSDGVIVKTVSALVR